MAPSAVEDHVLESPLVAPRAAVRLYMSRRSGLTLVRKPVYPVRGQDGGQITTAPGERVEFVDGVLRLPLTGTVKLGSGDPVPVEDLVEWLREHRLNGNREEGFWATDVAAPAPSVDEIGAITRFATELDSEGLERLLREEKAGWGRAPLLEAATAALEGVESARTATQQAYEADVAAASAVARDEGRKEAQAEMAAAEKAKRAAASKAAEK